MPNDQSVEIASIKKTLLHKGMVWDLVSETFEFNGVELTREYVDHTGAVAVLAFNEKEELLLMKQYRRPVGKFLMELPAGLLDVPGESLLDCAKRELAEEASLDAASWSELISFHTTPGGNNEAITIFVAKELSETNLVFEATGEEADMPKSWVPINEALNLVLTGQIMSPSAVVGIMAYQLSKDDSPRS
jgi:8-oxo-dGTP pyrophosphatase MutT (NUDIX family)